MHISPSHTPHQQTAYDPHTLVRRYFDAQTTDEEESRLRHFLLTSPLRDADFEEARAVMGLVAMANTCHTTTHHTSRHRSHRVLTLAASFALLLSLGTLTFLTQSEHADNECVAYVNGHKVTDEQEVIKLLHRDVEQVDLNTTDELITEQMNELFSSTTHEP